MHRYETLDGLARVHGDAFYLLDLARFRANVRDLTGAFRACWPRTVLGYSYKTNWTPHVLRAAHEEGCLAEVVSRMELDLARRLGVPGDRILFNGPLKTADDLEHALLQGAQVNVDSLAEVAAIEAIAARHPGASLRVGVRANLALDGAPSRFGLAGDELRQAVARLRALPGVELAGLHCHLSARRSLADVRARAERLAALSLELFPDAPPATIDLGGGLYGRLPASLLAQVGAVPAWQDLADTVAGVLRAAWPDDATAPTLVLEPGAALVADAFSLACRVAAVKRLDGRDVAVVTGSIQEIKSAPTRVRLPLTVVRAAEPDPASLTGLVDIGGYTCMESDVLQEAVPGPVGIGDWIVIDNVGSYSVVFKPPFIRPAPAILATDGAEPSVGTVIVARRGEALDDLLAAYELEGAQPS